MLLVISRAVSLFLWIVSLASVIMISYSVVKLAVYFLYIFSDDFCIHLCHSRGIPTTLGIPNFHFVVRNSSVLFQCLNHTNTLNLWKFEDTVLFINKYRPAELFGESIVLFENSSLYIETASIMHQGLYECSFNSSSFEQHYLTIHVPPQVLLSYNGVTVTNTTYDRERPHEIYVGEEETYVESDIQVNVTCLAEGAKPEATLTWTKNGEPIDTIVDTKTTRNLKENRTFDTISTLQFTTNEENITVTCNSSLNGTDIETLASATFLTFVKPFVFFLLDGKRVSDSVYVREDKNVTVTCYAEGARPAVNLTLEGSNIAKESFSKHVRNIDSATFDTNLTFTVEANFDVEIVSCTSTITEINENETVSLQLNTYVLTKPVITVNGDRSDTVIVDPDDKVTIVCNASATKPKPSLTLTRNGEPFHDTKSDISGSSGVIALFNFLPNDGDTVMCLNSIDKVNVTEMAHVTFNVNGSSDQDLMITLVLLCTAAIIIILLVFIVYIAARRCKGSQSTNLSANQGIGMEDTSKALVTTHTTNPQKEYLEETSKTYPKPPDLDLPKVPSDPELHQYSDLPETNAYEMSFHTEYYSEMSSKDANRKMFSGKDICFILNMKTGHIYNRWMGSIAVSKEEKKCVILSTVTDDVFRKNEIQWDKFVKQMLEVPQASHLSKVEGIGISKGKLYLIHEHMTCETLDARISVPFSRTEVMGHMLGILEAIEIIQSSGLLHPGFSTKKILLTEQGICKLYDFCLSEDAINIVKIKRSRMVYTLNQFASEALLRDKYSKASDIWSVAVVIWEILSCGSCPFPNEEVSPDSQNLTLKLPETWPTKYKLLRNKLLYECWNQDTSLRPTIQQLKLSFVESFESLDTYGTSDTSTDMTATSYVHMKGIEKSDD